MPRYFNGGADALDAAAIANQVAVDDEDRKRIMAEVKKHHPMTAPARENIVARDGRLFVRKPDGFCRVDPGTGKTVEELVPYEKGSICFGLKGHGFYVVPPGGFVDLDVSVPESVLRARAPHLLSEAEAIAKGVAKAHEHAEPAKRKPVA